MRVIKITFEAIALKLQEELADIIENNKDVNDYELIVYKYVFISELKVPLLEDLGIEIEEDFFVLYIIPDDLEFDLLRKLDDVFDKFKVTFMPNDYNILKLKFTLSD
ncbi:MAG: hypothetical protein IJG09_05270 [Methanobrevibacter sp.]|nr:hypothetical protein [Methanobrevibacter sp.]